MSRTHRFFGLLVVFLSAAFSSKATDLLPIQVQNGNDSVRAKFMWLDFGNVANNTTKILSLRIRNVTGQRIVLDAFSWSSSLQVRWAGSDSVQDLSNRTTLEPGAENSLNVRAFFSDADHSIRAISIMRSGAEITQIVEKGLIRPTREVSKIADQSPAAFLFSGNGTDWSGWYELRLGATPPGYDLEKDSVRFSIQEIPGEANVRRCGAWAVCEELQTDDNDVAFRFTVQGAHEGGLMQTNSAVRFYARLEATYALKESVNLAAFDPALVAAFSAHPSPPTPKQPAPASRAAELAGVFLTSPNPAAPTLPSPPPEPPLSQLKPALWNSCSSGKLDDCVELALWTNAQPSRSDRLSETLTLLDKACEGGDGRGCTWSGLFREDANPQRSAMDLQKACTLSDGLGCYQLGQLYEREGASKVKIQTTYTSACRNRFPAPGCQGKVHLLATKSLM